MSNRYVSTLFNSGEEFEEFLRKLEQFKLGVESGEIVIPKAKTTANVNAITNDDDGNNANVKFTIGDKTFSKVVNKVAEATKAINVNTLTNDDTDDNANVKFSIGDKTFSKTVNKVAEATKAINVNTLTNSDTGDNANVKFTIGDKTFSKTVTKVAEATKATQDGNGKVIADTYVPKTRKVNGKALSSDVTLSANDVGAAVIKDQSGNVLKTVTFSLSGSTLNIITT